MKNEIPEIDTLLDGINDPDLELGNTANETDVSNNDMQTENPIEQIPTADDEKCWKAFLDNLTSTNTKPEKDERLVCKIDRDLADSLDDCDIGNRCRSDLVNAIVRAFFGTFISRLANYQREKKSLFKNFTRNPT